MLVVENVFKSYKNKEVLKGVNFNIAKNEIKALIGINGAGKSTLVEIICNVKKYDSGKILLNGVDISSKRARDKNKFLFGYMPQSFCMFTDLTVKENLSYVASVYNLPESQVDDVIKTCNLGSYSNVIVKNLSGGYKQLLSMAVAIIHKPKFLVLDEPTTAMDPLFRKQFWKIVKKFRKNGGTVMLITHYVEELLECDSFACLAGGKIVLDESVDKIKKQNFVDIEKILRKCEIVNNE